MKYKIKDLVKLLVQSTTGVPKGELKLRLENYFKFLEIGGATALLPRVLDLFEHEWNKANKIKEVAVFGARVLPKNIIKELKDYFGEDAEIKETVDASLIGGVRIKVDDLLIDATLKNRIEMLKQQINNA